MAEGDVTPDLVPENKKSSEDQASSHDEYFTSYEDINVHELMLKDRPRTLAYKNYIEQNKDLFRDKVVVDVGAGTGILSLFAAKAGARKVYAIEASDLSKFCEQIVAHNGFSDRVTVIHGNAEQINLPDGEEADILISEWMGFYLFHESMLNSIIRARDRLLSADGIILPSTAAVYVCPVSMREFYKEQFDFWRNVYGFDFSPILPTVQSAALSQPVIKTLKPNQCLANPELLTHLDLRYVLEEDINNIIGNFTFQITKNDVLHGFACWFDVIFEGKSQVSLSTGPEADPTHWQQTVIMLPSPLLVSKEETVACRVEMMQDGQNPRRYNISIEVEDGEEEEEDDGAGIQDNGNISNEIKHQLMEAMNPQ